MRNAILGTVAGLLVGSVGALAYTHYVGEGSLLADLQAQLDSANQKLAKSEADRKFLAEQAKSETDQTDALMASNEQLKKQVADGGQAPAPDATPSAPTSLLDPNIIRGIMGAMRGGMAGGFRSPEQRMLVMQTRLKLDPEQAKAIKAAMDADEQARRDAFRQARQNHTMPDLSGANSLDKTLQTVLSPSQQTQYQQLQSDEKAARAETTATSQVDNLMPLLQMTDDQKEKAMNALYQQQLNAPEPTSLLGNPNALNILAQQGQTMQTAMKQVLTPDQYTLYQQSDQLQQQMFANGGGGGGRRANNNGANGGANAGGGNGAPGGGQASGMQTANTPAPSAAPTNAPSPATASDGSATTNAPSATTNAAAASATPPAPAAN
jgi:hypothetical protein